MTQHIPIRYLQNPITGIVRKVSADEGRRLARYGWAYVTRADYRAWFVADTFKRYPITMKTLAR